MRQVRVESIGGRGAAAGQNDAAAKSGRVLTESKRGPCREAAQ